MLVVLTRMQRLGHRHKRLVPLITYAAAAKVIEKNRSVDRLLRLLKDMVRKGGPATYCLDGGLQESIHLVCVRFCEAQRTKIP